MCQETFRGRTGNFVCCQEASSSAFKETGSGSAGGQEGCKDFTEKEACKDTFKRTGNFVFSQEDSDSKIHNLGS